MVFYILIVLVVLAALVTATHFYLTGGRYFYDAVTGLIGGAFVSSICAFVVAMLLTSFTPAEIVSYETHKYELRAMGTSTSISGGISGGIFVTTGYVNERQVFSYLRDDGNGGTVLRQANADDAVVYEGAEIPTVEFFTVTGGRPMIYPWTHAPRNQEFVFRVPDGSVSSEIAVTP